MNPGLENHPFPTPTGLMLRSHPHLYEINTWAWLEALSRQHGREIRLRDIPDGEWDGLQALGFDLVWLMGIWQRSPESQRIARSDPTLLPAYDRALPGWTPEDIVGSPFPVQAYEPDLRIGSWDDLAATQRTLHARGMRLILDFVPNHTARDHSWVDTHPDRYIQGTPQWIAQNPGHGFQPSSADHMPYIAHGKDPYFPPWTDTAQLNYYNPGTRAAMLRELQTIAGYCDGVRCDMAMLILNRVLAQTWRGLLGAYPPPSQEFWAEVREALPRFLLIGEVYWNLEWELQQLGFDYTYDKRLYDRLGRNDPQGVRDHLAADLSFQRKLVRFIENHDEPRSADLFGTERLLVALTCMSTLPGMRLYHQGQLEGRRVRLPVQLRRTKPEKPDPQVRDWHDRILKITDLPLFHEGMWHAAQVRARQDDSDQSNQSMIAYSWQFGDELCVVVMNFSAWPAQGRLFLHPSVAGWMKEHPISVLEDVWNGVRISCASGDLCGQGVDLQLKPFESALFWNR